MPVRSAYPGTALTGEVLTALKVNNLPGGWIGYAEVAADQLSITTVVDLSGLVLNVTVGASRRLRVTVYTSVYSTVVGDSATLSIKEGATQLSTRAEVFSKASTLEGVSCAAIVTPTAGAHTYKATLERTTGTGTLLMGASGTQPAFILVEDIGPA